MRILALVGVVFSIGCGNDAVDSELTPDAVPEIATTWYQDVQPIVAAKCAGCHQAGGIAPFALTDYDSAREQGLRMLHEVDRGAMPPFDARDEADCTPRFQWVDDPRLTDAETATLHAWVDRGYAAGDPVAFPLPDAPVLANITKTLTPVEGWATSGTRDQFICYVLDPGNTQLEWLTGLQVRPGNNLVVHHAVITELDGSKPDTQALVAEHGIGMPFDCGTMATPSDFVVHIWTPGNQPMETNGDIAVPMLPDAKLVVQIHYHPGGVSHAPDKTAIDLRFGDRWPTKMYFVTAFGNASAAPELLAGPGDRGAPEFRIPANAEAHTEHMRVTLGALGGQEDIRLFSVNPHMHLLGTHISTTIERATPTATQPATECLANGGWNFDWQRTYTYDAPIAELPQIAEGDTIDLTCTWNNSPSNPFMARMLEDAGLVAPIDLALGEETINEMCLEIFGIAIDAPANPAGLLGRDLIETLKLPGTTPVAELFKRRRATAR